MAAEHAGHQGSIVKADARLFGQHRVQHGEISALHAGGQFLVIGDVLHHIVVHQLHLLQGVGDALGQLRRLGPGVGGLGIVHILVGVGEGGKLVGHGRVEGGGDHGGILAALGVLIHRHLIAAVAVGQGEGGPAARRQVVCIGGGGALHLGLQPLVRLGGVLYHHIAVLGVGVVHHRLVVLLGQGPGGGGGQTGVDGPRSGGQGHHLVLQCNFRRGRVSALVGRRGGSHGLDRVSGGILGASGQHHGCQGQGQHSFPHITHRTFPSLSLTGGCKSTGSTFSLILYYSCGRMKRGFPHFCYIFYFFFLFHAFSYFQLSFPIFCSILKLNFERFSRMTGLS